jgi:hypothetical protein
MDLVDKHVILDLGDRYKTGKIVGVISDQLFFFQPDNMFGNDLLLPMEAYHMNYLADVLDDDRSIWNLFETRTDLDKFLKWLSSAGDKTENCKVVPIRTKDQS